MKRLALLVLAMILFPILAFAGSIQMSTKDAATGEEKTIMDTEVDAHPPN